MIKQFAVAGLLALAGGFGSAEPAGGNHELVFTGLASWYSETDPGMLPTTANLEPFDDSAMTCAMWDVPFHSRWLVTNTQTGRSVVVRVNDRGPNRRLVAQGRVVDLTRAAFEAIADPQEGLISVRLTLLSLPD